MNEPTPIRLQRRRTKGFRLVSPNGLPNKCVTRPGPFGNLFRGEDFGGAENAVHLFEMMLGENFDRLMFEMDRLNVRGWEFPEFAALFCAAEKKRQMILSRIHELRGHNLACFCGDKPCHADVLLRIANE